MGRGLVASVFLSALAATVASAGEEPLPLKSAILNKEGTTYVVEGRQTLPWGAEISVQKDTKIVGNGAGSVLVVEGSLQVHGVAGGEVEIENLRIEPAAKFQEIRLDTVLFRSGGVVTADKTPADGHLVVENTDFDLGTQLDVTFCGGKIDLFNATFRDAVKIHGVPPEGKGRFALAARLIGCFYHPGRPTQSRRNAYSGFLGGLTIHGVPDTVVRECRLAGDLAEFADCASCTFDGNKVNSAKLLFRQGDPMDFRKTKLQKCDIYTSNVVFSAPVGKRKVGVVIDKCWFFKLEKKEDILQKVIRDGDDDPKCGVFAVFRKINKRPLQLAGRA